MKNTRCNIIMDDGQDQLMDSKAVQKYLRIGRTKLFQLYETPGFPCFRLSKRGAWMVRRPALDRWLDDLSGTPDKTF